MRGRPQLGFLGAWGLSVIAAGLSALAAAGEWENWRDEAKVRRLERIDRLIALALERHAAREGRRFSFDPPAVRTLSAGRRSSGGSL